MGVLSDGMNMYTKAQKVPSKQVKDNWDKMEWNMDTLKCVKEDSKRKRKKYVFEKE